MKFAHLSYQLRSRLPLVNTNLGIHSFLTCTNEHLLKETWKRRLKTSFSYYWAVLKASPAVKYNIINMWYVSMGTLKKVSFTSLYVKDVQALLLCFFPLQCSLVFIIHIHQKWNSKSSNHVLVHVNSGIFSVPRKRFGCYQSTSFFP